MKLKSIVFVGLVGISLLGAGCSVQTEPAVGSESQTGTVEMQLQGTAPSGNTYRLRSAVFTIVDSAGTAVAVLDSEGSPPDALVLTASLGAGNYSIALADGWSIEKNGQPVQALLTSAQTQPVTVLSNQATPIRYAFKVGAEPVVLGGAVEVSIDIVDCTADQFEPNDTRETAAGLTVNPLSASICGDDDWYAFSVGVPAGTPLAFTLDFVHAVGDLDMELVQPDGTSLLSAGTSNQERINFLNQDGLYALHILGFNGAVGDYTATLIAQ